MRRQSASFSTGPRCWNADESWHVPIEEGWTRAMPLTVGTRLGPYEIVAAIGSGGMGEVYRARDPRLDRTVAIKVLPAHVAANPQARERFEREARAVAALNHPHICTLHDIGQQDGIDFLVMEYLEGQTHPHLAGRSGQSPAEYRSLQHVQREQCAQHEHPVRPRVAERRADYGWTAGEIQRTDRFLTRQWMILTTKGRRKASTPPGCRTQPGGPEARSRRAVPAHEGHEGHEEVLSGAIFFVVFVLFVGKYHPSWFVSWTPCLCASAMSSWPSF